MFYALSFLLIVYIIGERRKERMRKALENFQYSNNDQRERQKKDEDIQKFYDFNKTRHF